MRTVRSLACSFTPVPSPVPELNRSHKHNSPHSWDWYWYQKKQYRPHLQRITFSSSVWWLHGKREDQLKRRILSHLTGTYPALQPLPRGYVSKTFISRHFHCCCLQQWLTIETKTKNRLTEKLRGKTRQWYTLGNTGFEKLQHIPGNLEGHTHTQDCTCSEKT